ncbi:hypothetical protein [Neorhizobium sp. NCHU2750]|uniref:hypothetical protein n=1 Tax=Neorhizobium sp. NCHU2750 TaxID=1825976 RepID=UPI000E753912|nr:hypothetical protein NCHU2750_16410 [Neorhizobium sp. NCHU2750]
MSDAHLPFVPSPARPTEPRLPPFDSMLAVHAAEALGLPHMVCGRRSCRRAGRCGWVFNGSKEPCCLANLDREQRALFDRVYKAAHFAKGFLGWDSDYFQAVSRPQSLLDDLAIAIARNVPNRWWPERWDAARRAREKRMTGMGSGREFSGESACGLP